MKTISPIVPHSVSVRFRPELINLALFNITFLSSKTSYSNDFTCEHEHLNFWFWLNLSFSRCTFREMRWKSVAKVGPLWNHREIFCFCRFKTTNQNIKALKTINNYEQGSAKPTESESCWIRMPVSKAAVRSSNAKMVILCMSLLILWSMIIFRAISAPSFALPPDWFQSVFFLQRRWDYNTLETSREKC